MISPANSFKFYVASKPVDFRKGMDGLAAIVMNEFDRDPFNGAIFVFRLKRSDRMKLIFWDGTGLVMTYKRIEGAGFVWPRMTDGVITINRSQFEALFDDLNSSSKLLMDETTLAQLMPDTGKTKTCFVWALCRDDRRWKRNAHPAVAFHFEQSRKGEHAEEILDGFKGTLQVDGYAGYNRLTRDSRDGGPLTLAYCWAHVRRKFFDVHKATKSDKALQVLTLINDIYAIEHDLKGSPQMCVEQSGRQKVPFLVAQLHLLLLRLSGETSMKSTLGQAICYTMKLWDGLNVFLSDGRVEMDNNAVGNTIRPIALLRKNALFAGSEIGGRNWAVMASLISTCRLNGVEPYAYLTWVFEQMAMGHPRSQYEQLLPWYCPNGKFGIE